MSYSDYEIPCRAFDRFECVCVFQNFIKHD